MVAIWVLIAAASNLAVPQLERVIHDHSRAFFPQEADSGIAGVRMGQVFGDAVSNNIAYVVLAGNQPLSAGDRAYYDQLIAKLRADTAHVISVMDLWSQPSAAPMVESADGRVTYVMVRPTGEIGSAEAARAIAAVRDSVTALPRPAGLEVYVTGPGPTIVDTNDEVDRQLLFVTAVTVAVIALLLLLVYRSVIAAAIPLVAVGLSLAVGRPVVAALGAHGVIEVSIYSVSLMSALVLGAGTDYGIFMLGRYHENRRSGLDPDAALIGAYRSVAPVIVASALTISAALACLVFTKVSLLRSAGIPSSIAILLAMVASLTILPALIALASRRGLIEPHASRMVSRWRRIGTAVARWPAPLLVLGIAILLICAVPLVGVQFSYNVPRLLHSPNLESNRGYDVVDQHFPPNRLLPQFVLIESDHDLRNPAGLIAIERVARQMMAVRGVQSVQSASRPAGVPLTDASLTHQAGVIGDQLKQSANSLQSQLDSISSIQNTLDQLAGATDQLNRSISGTTTGLTQVGNGIGVVQSGVQQVQGTVATLADYAIPLRQFTDNTPDCPVNPLCSAVLKVLDPLDSATRSVADLSLGADKLAEGTSGATTAIGGAPAAFASMRAALGQLRPVIATLSDVTNSVVPQIRDVSGYLTELGIDFQGSGEGGFYLPQRAFDDPRFEEVNRLLYSPDGTATRLLVYGDAEAWSLDGAHLAKDIELAAQDATKEGTLAGSTISVSGVGGATRDLEVFSNRDFVLLAVVALILVFLIVALMLRSPVAGVVVVATVIASYASAMGASVLIWQHLLGQELAFVVPPLAFIALVAVGADYNLLLVVRIQEEAGAGLRTGIIRAFGGTGGVVTTAGVVFGVTMFSMLAGEVLTLAQVGSTIGIGLLIDTLVVRAIVVPAIVALFGPWFWWPRRITARRRR